MTFGWFSAAAAWASAWNRLRNAASLGQRVVEDLDRHPAPQLGVVGQEDPGRRAAVRAGRPTR